MARIAIGGFGHETNSFTADKADFEYFRVHRDRPPLVRGVEIFEWLQEGSFPITSFMADLEKIHELIPLIWAHGSAGGPVTECAFERIVGELIGRLSEASPVDAVYLDLHGAMVSEPFEDAEGELLRRVRATVGNVPIVVSLDYHANITPEMVEFSDGLVAFRTYPHIDRPETGRRAAKLITSLLDCGRPSGRAFRKIPFLIPTTEQCTLVEPSRSIVAASETHDGDVLSLIYAAGFAPSDLYWCGPTVVAHAYNQEAADRAVDELANIIVECETEFVSPLLSPEQGVRQAIDRAEKALRPIVIADVQDNPGGGGTGDTTSILKELMRSNATGAVIGIFCDPDAASAAHNAGVGSEIELSLGGHGESDQIGPVTGRCTVRRLGGGPIRTTGRVAGGLNIDLGLMALLVMGGIEIVVASKRMQAMDLAPFHHLGVNPAKKQIVVVKSAVHFRAEFEPMSEAVLLVAAPGNCPENPEKFPYQRLRPGVRLRPMGATFNP